MSRLGSLAWLCAFVVLGACARGGAADGGDDTTDQPPDDDDDDDDAQPIDAAPRPDSPPPIDSPLPIDSPPPIDAAPDAPNVQPDACVPGSTQFLTNPAFDTGPGTWQEVPITDPDGVPFPIVVTAPAQFPAQSPGYVAWLGGISSIEVEEFFPVTDEIYQIVGIAPGATGITLSGYWAVDTAEADDGEATDDFTLEIRSTTGALLQQILVLNNTAQVNPAWTAFSVPITANIAGQNVRIRATSTNDLTLATSFFLDSLSLAATAPCP
jgi:hypothetical protein